MCGIVGYVGPRDAQDVLLHGLARLEYRGYDSAGLAVAGPSGIAVAKAEGKLVGLVERLEPGALSGHIGIGHTRWATHGAPSDRNAHPHSDTSGDFVVVHNGIVENHLALRRRLERQGVVFRSDTDTEVLVHLVAQAFNGSLAEAVRCAIDEADGAYALVVMSSRVPDEIVAARRISPLVVGLGQGETFLASDIPAVLKYTNEFLLVDDGEIATVTREGAVLETFSGDPVSRQRFTADWDVDSVRKGGFEHFMLKEIHEQPDLVARTIRASSTDMVPGPEWVGSDESPWAGPDAEGIDRIWITACGTAYHAGLVGRTFFEHLAGIPTEVVYAHELRYSRPLFRDGALTLAISQSGETVDTLAGARLARQEGSRLLAITNVVGSSLAREADDVHYILAGPEVSVASTKAYTGMLLAELLMAARMGRLRGVLSPDTEADLWAGLRMLPDQMASLLDGADRIIEVAETLAAWESSYFIGRGVDFPTALEGALKLKEISYLHAEAMPAGELKHGTLALVSEGTPVVAVLTQSAVHAKMLLGLQEVKARRGVVIAVAYEDDEEVGMIADHVLRIPRTNDYLAPILAAIPLQLLAYFVARHLGRDIDQPRNLAKSVTVE